MSEMVRLFLQTNRYRCADVVAHPHPRSQPDILLKKCPMFSNFWAWTRSSYLICRIFLCKQIYTNIYFWPFWNKKISVHTYFSALGKRACRKSSKSCEIQRSSMKNANILLKLCAPPLLLWKLGAYYCAVL